MNKDVKFFMKRFIVYGLIMVSPIIVACTVCTIAGCQTKPDYSNIPLTSGDAPYRIQKGVITDSRGVVHNEKDYRWSVSEEFMYEAIKNTK
jgi:hypothetical protein